MQLLCCLHPCNVPVESQLEAQRPDGITVHLDFGVPSARWAVELDIHPEHRTVDGHHRDAGRIRSLHRFGWQIEPVAELDMGNVGRVADELTALYVDRARSIGVPNVPTGGRSALGCGRRADRHACCV